LAGDYPDRLRRVRYYDAETDKNLVFMTNNFLLPAITIAQLYKQRWQVELFFKWIKQNLRIKSFYGTSENAVLDRRFRLSDRGDHQKTAESSGKSLHNVTGLERLPI
jgi:transposase